MVATAFFQHLPEIAAAQSQQYVGARLIGEYGAIFVANGGALPPDRLIFKNENEVSVFQRKLQIGSIRFAETTIELQTPAIRALQQAINDASASGQTISPRSVDSGRRNYQLTVELWASRVEPAIRHWHELGRISETDADYIRSLTPFEQVLPVFELEDEGIYFAKDLLKSIIYSVAPPGASQHLSMLAFDVAEFDDDNVRRILASHGWYQTVPSDLPHFTYLGLSENELVERGLKQVTSCDRPFWVPDI
jgi:hypothetical protein